MKLISELKRRNVLRMAALYVLTAWLIMQVAEVLIALGRLPEASGPTVLDILAVGFPIALVLSWFLEGTRPDAMVDDAERQSRGRRTDFAIIGVLAVALALFIYVEITKPKLEQSVAVLPFEDLTGDTEDSYLSSGITEEIRHRLTTFGNLTVIDRYSVDKVEGLALATIASKLNVEHVLQGSVRRSGNRVRILASLVNAETNETTWSDSYDRDLTVDGLFEVQVDISKAIAGKLRAVISPEASAGMVHAPTRDFEAYRLYLLGIDRLDGRNIEEWEQARGFFERAIEIDPEFAEAYAYQAFTWNCNEDCRRESITNALALDDTLGIAHAGRGLFLEDAEYKRDAFELALRLSPADALVWELYGDYLRSGPGDFQAALNAYERAIALQPLRFRLFRFAGQAAFMHNRPEKAVELFERAIAIEPDYAKAYAWYAVAIWNFNQEGYDKAMALLHKASELDPKDSLPVRMLGWLCVDLGELEGAEALFAALSASSGLAVIHHLRGEHDRELEELETRQDWFYLASHYFDARHFDEAVELIREVDPNLVETLEIDTDLPRFWTMGPAFQLARVLESQGKIDEADKLWDQLDRLLDESPLGYYGAIRYEPALMHARRGRNDTALQYLRDIIDGGWRAMWRQALSRLELDVVRDDPRFQQMVAELEADMADQLAKVHAKGLACDVPAGFRPDAD